MRLRVHIPSQNIREEVVSKLNGWLSTLAIEGEIEEFHLCPYKREVERYGGPECIQLAEEVFYQDSQCALNVLEQGESPLPHYLIASMGILNIAHRFFPDIKELLSILTPNQEQLHLLDGIRSHSKIGISFARAIFSGEKTNLENMRLQCLLENFSQMHPALDRLVKKVMEVQEKKDSWVTSEQIIHSLIHMHCNRLLGIASSEEQKARIAASYFLEKLLFQLQFVKK